MPTGDIVVPKSSTATGARQRINSIPAARNRSIVDIRMAGCLVFCMYSEGEGNKRNRNSVGHGEKRSWMILVAMGILERLPSH